MSRKRPTGPSSIILQAGDGRRILLCKPLDVKLGEDPLRSLCRQSFLAVEFELHVCLRQRLLGSDYKAAFLRYAVLTPVVVGSVYDRRSLVIRSNHLEHEQITGTQQKSAGTVNKKSSAVVRSKTSITALGSRYFRCALGLLDLFQTYFSIAIEYHQTSSIYRAKPYRLNI